MERTGGSNPQGTRPTENEFELQDSSRIKENSNDSGMYESRVYYDTVEANRHLSTRATDTEPTKPAAIWERPDYSDLEVCEVIPPTWDGDDKMPVVVYADEKELSGTLLTPCVTDPVPAYSPHLMLTPSQVPLHTKGEYAGWKDKSRDMSPIRNDRRVLGIGMSKKRLSLIGVGVLAFILILLATVLGITLTMNMVSRNKNPSEIESRLLLDNSGLAAVNWTDATGADRAAVFYQDNSNSILVSLRDSVSNEWSRSNVTAALMDNTGAKKLDVLPGTPLAVTTNRYQVSLYYLTTENTVAEIWTSDIVGEVWFAGSLGNTLSPLVAANGSHISAYWHVDCNNCSTSLYVAFQDDRGSIQLANMTDSGWEFADTPDDLSPVIGTGLAIRPFTEDNGAGEYLTDPGSLRLFSFNREGLVESAERPGTNFTWVDTTASTTLSSTIATDPSSEVAAITFGEHGQTNSLVNYLAPDGSIMSYFYNGTSALWTSRQPTITGFSANFSAIAAAQNMLIYATFNGSIYEFEVDKTDPLSWTEVSTVMAREDD